MTGMPGPTRSLRSPANDDTPTPQSRLSAALLTAFTNYVEAHGGGEGYFPTAIDGMRIIRAFRPIEPNHRIYQPSLCIVIEGAKQIEFGDDMLDYETMQCLVVSVELPATGRIVKASRETPFISVTIDFDVATLRDVLGQMDVQASAKGEGSLAPFIADVDEPLAECILRLMRMLEAPKSIPILYPSVMRDICYWLLSGPHGAAISRLALPESHTERIVNAIYHLRDSFTQTLRIEQLAERARMSPSSFHQHFKALTAMSPLQYQKQLRLLEARRLMVAEGMTVSEAAYRVGYESASQFSRDYSRTFGAPPKRNVMSLRADLAQHVASTPIGNSAAIAPSQHS
jgi:AraC-like DNA-binding protein